MVRERNTFQVLVVNDTSIDNHQGCQSVMSAISALLRRNGMQPAFFWPAHTAWQGKSEFEEALAKVDLVLINGEGTIHHDREAGKRLLDIGTRARSAGVPIALINVGWEKNSTALLSLLDHFDLIAARDSRSAERMRAGGAVVRVVPDLSIWFANSQGFIPDRSTPRSAIGFTDNVDRFKALTLDELRSKCLARPVSITYGDGGCAQRLRFIRGGVSLSRDLLYPARFLALLRLRQRLWRVCGVTPQEFLSELSAFRLLVSGRFHACTMALSVGTPLIAQASNTDKISALFQDVGLDSWRCDSVLNEDFIGFASDKGFSDREYKNLCSYVDWAVTESQNLFIDLKKMVMK